MQGIHGRVTCNSGYFLKQTYLEKELQKTVLQYDDKKQVCELGFEKSRL